MKIGNKQTDNIIHCNGLQEIDPCDDLTDDEIRTAIQNATGTKTALFVPEVRKCLFVIGYLDV